MKNLLILLFCGLSCLGQEDRGKLLLLKVDIERDLQIDSKQIIYLVLEMQIDGSVKNNSKSKHVFFNGFHDADIISCIKKDSIEIATGYSVDTYGHDNLYLRHYADIFDNNVEKMNYLMSLNVNSSLYNEKLKISYVFMSAHYCKGASTRRDSEMIGIERDIILIIDELTFDTDYKISKENLYDVIKAINFNSFIW